MSSASLALIAGGRRSLDAVRGFRHAEYTEPLSPSAISVRLR